MEDSSLFDAMKEHSDSLLTDDSCNVLIHYNFDFDATDFSFPKLDLHFNSLEPAFSERQGISFHTDFTDRDVNPSLSLQDWLVSSPNTANDSGYPPLFSCGENERSFHETDTSSLCPSEEKAEAHDNPEKTTQHDSRSDSKRQWKDNVTVFSSKDDWKVVQKRRREYSPSRRRTVAINRIIGSCIQCKLRKEAVSRFFVAFWLGKLIWLT
jgi:hypothetical protein